MSTTPTGTVTFLFTDIEGSTRLWEKRPDEMRAALAEHDALLRAAIDAHNGYVFSTGGDGFAVAFSRAHDAVEAARKAQVALADHSLIRVRMGVHTGEVQERDGDYFGPAVNRAARIMATGHGGQVLLSAVTRALLEVGHEFRDLGEHRLRDLSSVERLFQLGDAIFPALRTTDVGPNNLPLQLTDFLGREELVEEIHDLISTHRLVTLTGVGGVGKTRLALHTAARLLPAFPDGVWLCELATLTDPTRVANAIAASLRVPDRSIEDTADTIIDVVGSARVLLVLDNCEHVIDVAARLIQRLVSGCEHLGVLATSREALGVGGERVVRVPSLLVGESDWLFLERAVSADHAFALDEAGRASIGRICTRLDGIPLAIELAAARAAAMPVDEIERRLDQRFRLLTGGSRAALERHQTLQAAVSWSYDLLSEPERAVFVRLSVFVGGFTLNEAEQVVSGDGVDDWDVVDLLGHLVAKSLVIRQGDRYQLLETLRQFGRQKLIDNSEMATFRERHAQAFLAVAREAGRRGGGMTFEEFRHLAPDVDNLRAAYDWLLENDQIESALRILDEPRWLWPRWADETVQRYRRAFEANPPPSEQLVTSYAIAAWNASVSGDRQATTSFAERSLMLARDLGVDGDPSAPFALAMLAMFDDRSEEAVLFAQQSVDLAIARNDRVAQLGGLTTLARELARLGRTDDATEAFEVGYRLAAEGDAVDVMMHPLEYNYAFDLVRTDAARGLGMLERAATRPGIQGHPSEVWAVYHLAAALHQLDQRTRAAHWLRVLLGLPPHRQLTAIAGALDLAAHVLVYESRGAPAAVILGASERLRIAIGLVGQRNEVAARADANQLLTTLLSQTDIERLHREGRALTLEQSVRAARSPRRTDRGHVGGVNRHVDSLVTAMALHTPRRESRRWCRVRGTRQCSIAGYLPASLATRAPLRQQRDRRSATRPYRRIREARRHARSLRCSRRTCVVRAASCAREGRARSSSSRRTARE